MDQSESDLSLYRSIWVSIYLSICLSSIDRSIDLVGSQTKFLTNRIGAIVILCIRLYCDVFAVALGICCAEAAPRHYRSLSVYLSIWVFDLSINLSIFFDQSNDICLSIWVSICLSICRSFIDDQSNDISADLKQSC